MGIMFRGANAINLDVKGRVTIPTRYRQTLLDDCKGQLVCKTGNATGRSQIPTKHPEDGRRGTPSTKPAGWKGPGADGVEGEHRGTSPRLERTTRSGSAWLLR